VEVSDGEPGGPEVADLPEFAGHPLLGGDDYEVALPAKAWFHPAQGKPIAEAMMASHGGEWGKWFRLYASHSVRWSMDRNDDGECVVMESKPPLSVAQDDWSHEEIMEALPVSDGRDDAE
jgi:hypothetical protein